MHGLIAEHLAHEVTNFVFHVLVHTAATRVAPSWSAFLVFLVGHTLMRRSTVRAAVVTATPGATTASATHASEMVAEVLESLLHSVHVDVNISLTGGIFIDDGEHGAWSVFRSGNLEESMRVLLACLTSTAVVEVFSDGAFVAWTDDRCHTTAITLESFVDGLSLRLVRLIFGGFGLLGNLGLGLSLIPLLFDKALNNLTRVIHHGAADHFADLLALLSVSLVFSLV